MEGTGPQSYLNEQLNLAHEYEIAEEKEKKYKDFDDFLKVKYQELSLELATLRQKRIRNRGGGGDLLKRCAIVKKLMAIEDYFSSKNIRNCASNDQIKELRLELATLRQKKIENNGGDLLKRCAIVKKLMAIDDYFIPKNIRNCTSNDQIIYPDKSFYYGM